MKARNPSTGNLEEIYVKALDSLPVGTILEFPTTNSAELPIGYMFCDGSAISRTTYSTLFALIGTSYGVGDGSTTFNLPNYKGRVPVGLDSTQTEFDTLGETGGEKTHTLTINEMPSHQHKLTIEATDGSLTASGVKWASGSNYRQYGADMIEAVGGGQAHNNLQPYIVSNYIIKVAETRALAGKTVNAFSNSTTDAYSCDYINKLVKTGKTLWTGSFTEGTITVPELSNYSLLAISLDGGIICIGNNTWGIGGIGAYGSYDIQIYGYRFNPSGDTLTIDNVNKGGSDGTQNVPVVAIRGIY